MAEFRKQRAQLQREHGGFESGNGKAFSETSYGYKKTILIPILVVLTVGPLLAWFQLGPPEAEEVRWHKAPAAREPRFSNALESPATDQLEERISSLTGNMEMLSGLITDLESKLTATDKLEERISGLTENLATLNGLTTDLESRQVATDNLEERISGLTDNMETLNSLTTDLESKQIATNRLEAQISGLTDNMETLSGLTDDLESKQIAANKLGVQISSLTEDMETLNSLTADLESRQMAADKLDQRIANITRDLQMLSDLAAGLESRKLASLATSIAIVPAQQQYIIRTKPEPLTVARKTPAVTRQASVPAIPTPEPVKVAQTSKRETLSTAPSKPRESVVSKQPAASKPLNRPWTINLISSPDKTYAVRFSDSAQSKGISTKLQEVTVKGTRYWRVQINGFSTQDEAKAYADTIKGKLGLKDTWIMRS